MSTQAIIEWRSFGLSSPGAVRKYNEDAMLILGQQQLWAVADGMGGHARGDLASSAIVEALKEFKATGSVSSSVSDIERRINGVNKNLFDRAGGHFKRAENIMGSTVAALYAHDCHVFCLWAGDSRIYRWRHGELCQLTHDHSFVQSIVDKGMMSESQAQAHPSANIITRAVGVAEKLVLDIDHQCVEFGDKFLLCTDGLFKELSSDDIAEALAQNPLNSAQQLIDTAVARGVNDNVSVVVVEAGKPRR